MSESDYQNFDSPTGVGIHLPSASNSEIVRLRQQLAERDAALASLKLGPLSNDDAPTDREWTDSEWIRNQWWLSINSAQAFERRLTERDAALSQVAALAKAEALEEFMENYHGKYAERTATSIADEMIAKYRAKAKACP